MLKPFLSEKPIPVRERLIFALDVPTLQQAEDWIERLGDTVYFYKLGLQIFMSGDYFRLVDSLRKKGKRVFVDLKFFDVPETVTAAVMQLKDRDVDFVTVHGNENMIKAAVKKKDRLKILAVTVLTSLDQDDIRALGFQCQVEELVLSRARRALQSGCDGVISSGLEAARLREELGDHFLIVSPGIRPVENRLADDQKRVVTVEQAFLNGADYIVVGRPIRNAPDPRAKAEECQRTIAAIFSHSSS
jgi:orotidine-5'-phosphate decarboxylase